MTGISSHPYVRAAAAALCGAALALACGAGLSFALPQPAHAAATDAQMETAFKRSVAKIKDYRNQPQVIKVKVSDLGLTSKQKQQVMDRVHYSGEYFWVNTLGNGKFDNDYLLYPCVYSDETIDRMRTKFEAGIKRALSGFDSTTGKAQRVHLLHDWIIRSNTWVYDSNYTHKSAYGTIAAGTGDCLSFTLGMQVLLKRAGLTTLYVQNMSVASGGGHAWNLVKIGSNWYHVDTTWDNSWTGKYFWKDSICHRWLLRSDSGMRDDDHNVGSGWTVFYKGALTTKYKARSTAYAKEDGWKKSCAKRAKVGTTFTASGVTYKVVSKKSVYVTRIASASKRKATTLTLRASVPYKGCGYQVIGIRAKSLSGTAAKTLKVCSTALSKDRVKGSLSGSRVKTVRTYAGKVAAYKSCFAKANSGRSVTVRAF
ncbi:MAG: transglutaminase domain-containing protein [Coriobacteriia bacterium]|nr:transglutaminase domain-containing protein [Coriobacteriia bacterium]